MAGSDVYRNIGFHQQTGRIPHVDRRRIRAPAKTAVDDEEEVEYANIEDSIEPEEKTPNSKKPLAEELKPQAATKSNACGAKSIVVLYILLIGSSAVWMALFSRAFAKFVGRVLHNWCMIGVICSMAHDVYGNSDFHQQTGQRKHRDRERYQAPDDDNEDDYENIEDSIELEEVKTNQTEAFKEKSKAQAAQDHNVCGTNSIVFLYVLLIASSVMWAALLSLLFVKYSQLSALVTGFGNDMSHLISKVCIETCPCEWISFNEACYYFSKERADWHKAKESCNSKNATLAVISSDQELVSRVCIETCPCEWISFNEACYYFSKERADWHKAKESCNSNNASLAVISSDQELLQRDGTAARDADNEDEYGNIEDSIELEEVKTNRTEAFKEEQKVQAAQAHSVCGTKSIVFLYVLLIASSVMWAALLSLLFVKSRTAVDDEEEVEYANIEDSIEPEEKTPNSKKPLAEELKPQAATKSNACGAKSIVVLYILLIGSSAVWMALFSRAFAKYSQLSALVTSFGNDMSHLISKAHSVCGTKSIVFLYVLLIASSVMWAALLSLLFVKYSQLSALVTSFGNDMSHLISKVCIKTCPCEWISFNGECYYFSKERADWHKAKEYCNSKNAFLAVISSDQELPRSKHVDPHPEVGRWDPGQPRYGPARDEDNEDNNENIEDSIELEEVKTNQTEACEEEEKAQAAQGSLNVTDLSVHYPKHQEKCIKRRLQKNKLQGLPSGASSKGTPHSQMRANFENYVSNAKDDDNEDEYENIEDSIELEEVKTNQTEAFKEKSKAQAAQDSQIVANFENYISKDSQIIENVTKLENYVYKVCANTCSGSWNLFNGAFYYFSKENKVWKEARTFCQSQNSDLAVINSNGELKYLQDKGTAHELWLGLSDSDEEGTWKWLDGRVVEKRLWHKGEPNNYQDKEDCGLLSNGLLNDFMCETKLHWICEKRL
ncbi:UNVERIFIED_CONTAM: hypothetical protein FKN15_025268 [Acipenser sinensis]